MKIDIELLKQIPIQDIARELGIVLSKGKGMCFYGHDTKTPSLSLNIKNNFWHCFGCGAGGDGIRLVQKYLNLDFMAACSWLCARFAINRSNYRNSRAISNPIRRNALSSQQRNDICKPDPEVYKWLIDSSSLSQRGLHYLVTERNLSHDTINHFNIKDLETPSRTFLEIKEKWGLDRLFQCGLAKKTDSGEIKFVWWDHIILFPFYNFDGTLGYIQGRRIGNKVPKYINLNGIKTEIFNLRVTNSLNNCDIVYICEGVMDALSAHDIGLNAVGIIGAMGFKHQWVTHFLDYRIRVIPDADKAGHEFAQKIKMAFATIGKSIEIVTLPNGMDFSEFISKGRKKEEHAQHIGTNN